MIFTLFFVIFSIYQYFKNCNMNMYFNYTPISVNQLEKDGFVVDYQGDESYYHNLKYGESISIVRIEKCDNKLYVSDIANIDDNGSKLVIRKLYELYGINLIDEQLDIFSDIMNLQENTSKELIDELYSKAFKETKESILCKQTF